ncbi:CoA-binding protein [Coleofasciculus sp. FACHB-1120]|uniref:succinate--CoA ligase subunit alpha n=1 Tax=Coleofasciculus sp. FACHB-1120 TaxID=2692783 RepID=UPI001683D08D|nr:CoA-binding protein [Coleofasciculus sp. FACHB-1120]MBD2742079.1 CoA-binding protein [Coleofasciculus sp. FACHB-1120]
MKLTPDSKILIQGIAEPLAATYTARMTAYGTKVVAAVSAGHGGQTLDGIPVFDLVEQAIESVGAVDISIIFVPPYSALDAALEAIGAGIRQIILITGGIPPLDMVRLLRKAEATQTLIVGPSSSGIIVPGKVLLGTHETEFYSPGSVGLLSCCGNLTYEVAWEMTRAGYGQSIAVSIGSEPFVGSSVVEWLEILAGDKNTKVIVLVSHIGSNDEQAAAEYIVAALDKPVIVYFVGRLLPQEKILGPGNALGFWRQEAMHASPQAELAAEQTPENRKIAAFKQAKIPIAERPSQIPDLVKKALKKSG